MKDRIDICEDCGERFNRAYHKKCPYCKERQINPLG